MNPDLDLVAVVLSVVFLFLVIASILWLAALVGKLLFSATLPKLTITAYPRWWRR